MARGRRFERRQILQVANAECAADQDRRRLGEGNLQLAEVIRGLVEAGYTGDFDVELIGQEIEPSQYDDVLKSSLEFFERVLTPA